jgi:hypothetical protein
MHIRPPQLVANPHYRRLNAFWNAPAIQRQKSRDMIDRLDREEREEQEEG